MSQGLNTAYAGAERSQAYPKLAKVNKDRGKTFMKERAKVVEVFRPMQNNHYPKYNHRCILLFNHYAYVKNYAIQLIKSYGKSTKHLCKEHGFKTKAIIRNHTKGPIITPMCFHETNDQRTYKSNHQCITNLIKRISL
jgi:hypothetical protein